mmetsp:Transcript_40846/g.108271  ORF Transcript_40846/g.108271 Transcript_40846/m.108271 type:complete len:228 (+) Transcript_40846:217-900(+)
MAWYSQDQVAIVTPRRVQRGSAWEPTPAPEVARTLQNRECRDRQSSARQCALHWANQQPRTDSLRGFPLEKYHKGDRFLYRGGQRRPSLAAQGSPTTSQHQGQQTVLEHPLSRHPCWGWHRRARKPAYAVVAQISAALVSNLSRPSSAQLSYLTPCRSATPSRFSEAPPATSPSRRPGRFAAGVLLHHDRASQTPEHTPLGLCQTAPGQSLETLRAASSCYHRMSNC